MDEQFSSLRLNLVVLRSKQVEQSVRFYRSLGLSFSKHRHGTGVEHYSSEIADLIFEIYPLAEHKSPTTETRLGFVVEDVDVAVSKLLSAGGRVISAPCTSEWGRRAVVSDPDGHRIELTMSAVTSSGDTSST